MPQLTTFLTQNGIPEEAIVWLFMLPIAVTLVVIGRQIIGIKGFGIATPILIGYAFVATGIQAGVIIFLAALGTGFVMRSLLAHTRLLYLPKMALILLGVIVASVILIPFLPYEEGLQFPQATFSFLILILAMEQFASFLIERGVRKNVWYGPGNACHIYRDIFPRELGLASGYCCLLPCLCHRRSHTFKPYSWEVDRASIL